MAYTKVRPDFDKAWCDMLIAHMADGLSFESFSGVIGVTDDDLIWYKDTFKPFQRAYDVGVQKSRLFWERLGICAITGQREMKVDETNKTFQLGNFNAGLWQFNMQNRFGWSTTIKPVDKEEDIVVELDEDLRKLQAETTGFVSETKKRGRKKRSV